MAFSRIRSNLSPKHSFKALLSSCLFVFRFDRSGSGSKIRFCWICPDAIINRCSCKFPLNKMLANILDLSLLPDPDYDVLPLLCMPLDLFADP